MSRNRYMPIATKINALIIVTLVIGIGAISFWFFQTITREIDTSIDANIDRQGEILYSAIQNFMLPGRAELAVDFFDDLDAQSDDRFTIRLIRSNGILAFSDFTTIDIVVERVPSLRERFADPSPRLGGEMAIMSNEFGRATSIPPSTVVFERVEDETTYVRAYFPLLNLPSCVSCHGDDHTVRGVIDIRLDITEQRSRQAQAGLLSGSLFLSIVMLLTIVLSLFLRRTVVRPVRKIGEICERVTAGEFGRFVEVRTRDEIGRLGNTVNTMVKGLHERFQLQKYVSSKTLESLLGDGTGRTTSLTLLFSDIRGFTSYTEKRSAEKVVRHLNAILNIQTEIIQRCGGDIDKYVGDEIVSMFSSETQAADAISAAIEIQNEIESHSETLYDGLHVGIGINTGEVILGMIGSEKRADYTFIGDNVNTAARLCEAADAGGILVAATTFEPVAGSFTAEGPFRLKAKGKEQYVKIFRVIATAANSGSEGVSS
jgi:adenylate cyclase